MFFYILSKGDFITTEDCKITQWIERGEGFRSFFTTDGFKILQGYSKQYEETQNQFHKFSVDHVF